MSIPGFSQLPPQEQEAILNGPALAAPENVVPNLHDPPNRNTLAYTVVAICLTVSTLLVLMRAYSRIFVLKSFKCEDILAFAALGTLCGYIYCNVRHAQELGFFVHQWDTPVKKIPDLLYFILIGSNLYAVVILCLKTAILLEWLRIFVPGKSRTLFFWNCGTIMVVNIAYYVAGLIALNLICTPYNAIWDITIEGKCLNQKAVNLSSAAINLVSDVAMILLVQQVIWSLHMSFNKKIGVSLIFAAGVFCCIASIFRLVTTLNYEKDSDLTYTSSSLILWGLGEMTAGFLVLCIPAAPKAFSNVGIPTRISSALHSLVNRSKSARDSSANPPGRSYREIKGVNEMPRHDLDTSPRTSAAAIIRSTDRFAA